MHEGCYTAMAQSIDHNGELVDPIRVPWSTGGAFTTPPGWWHIHVNETDEDAWVLPIQDAGLLTHQVCPPLHAEQIASLVSFILTLAYSCVIFGGPCQSYSTTC